MLVGMIRSWWPSIVPLALRGARGAVSDVQVHHFEGVLLDEAAAPLHLVPHEQVEDLLGGLDVLELHLEQGALVGIERRLPELLGVHLAEALVALDGPALLAAR